MDTPNRSPDGVIWAPGLALNTLTEKLRSELDLNSAEVGDAVTLLLTSEVDDQVKAEFLTALHKKGETAEEIAAFVRALMKRAVDPMIAPADMPGPMVEDRKSTRLNSSHLVISYAVFCLKKKN